jgi:hypothetical protein
MQDFFSFGVIKRVLKWTFPGCCKNRAYFVSSCAKWLEVTWRIAAGKFFAFIPGQKPFTSTGTF